MTQQIGYFLAGTILACWYFFFLGLSWQHDKSRAVNLVTGTLAFLFAGIAYILPFWLLWKG